MFLSLSKANRLSEQITIFTERIKMEKNNKLTLEYANKLNTVIFKDMSAQELNIFFALITILQNRGENRATVTYSEIKKAIGLEKSHITKTEFRDKLQKLCKKLDKLVYYANEPKDSKPFIPFSLFSVDGDNCLLTITAGQDLTRMLNKFDRGYTSFRLDEFVGVKGIYAKLLYLHLCQWRTTKEYWAPIDEFRSLLCIPENVETKDIKKDKINRCIFDLQKIKRFKNLTCAPQCNKSRQGSPITIYYFVWTARPKGKDALDKQLENKTAVSIEDVIAKSNACEQTESNPQPQFNILQHLIIEDDIDSEE